MDGATTRSRRKQQLALPTELWRIIILESLPQQNSFHTSLQRQKALESYSRISRSFSWIREELYREIHLEKWERSVKLLRTIQEDSTKRLGEMVKVLRVGNEFETLEHQVEGHKFELEDLLHHFTNLEVLFVGRIRNALSCALFQSPRTYHPVLISHRSLCRQAEFRRALSGLRQLHVWDSNFLRTYFPPQGLLDTSSNCLENLKHLTLEDSMLNHPPLSRDIPKTFPFHLTPNLTALNGHHSIPPNLSFLVSYSPNCRLDALIETPLLFFSSHSTQLCPHPGENDQPLSYLPSSLRFLRVTSGHFFGCDYLTPYFLSHPRSLPNLEELILPMRLRAAGAFENLREWAKARGVRIAWEKDEESPGTVWDKGFWEVVERVEEIVEREKRELQKRE